MKLLQTLAVAIGLVILFASCQSTSGQTQGLSNKETRKEIMNTIANDSMMSHEMMGAMLNGKNGMMMREHQMVIMGNHNDMANMLKDNTGMMQNMMSAMMETAKGDTSMMSGMIKTMMGNQQMLNMMQKMTGNNRMNWMHTMGGMNK